MGRNLQKLLSFYDLQEILAFKVRIYSIKLSVSRKKLRGNYSDDYIVDFLNNELFFFFLGQKIDLCPDLWQTIILVVEWCSKIEFLS